MNDNQKLLQELCFSFDPIRQRYQKGEDGPIVSLEEAIYMYEEPFKEMVQKRIADFR